MTSINLTTPAVRELAREHVQHSATDFRLLEERYPGFYPRVIVRGEGAYLIDDEGNRVLDGGNHLGTCQIGHGRAEIGAAMAEQAAAMQFAAIDSGVTHAGVAALAERLTPLLQLEDPLLVLGSSGSEANEVAFKIARVYHARRGQPQRVKIIARDGSYHGATMGATSANGMPGLREPYAPLLPGVVRTTQPSPGRCGYCDFGGPCVLGCADEVERTILREGPDTVAAMIAEPIAVQQAIKVPDQGYWPRIREICDRYGVLLIVDEVVTGFGRTGRTFAIEHWGVQPDITTMAKGVTSGYFPLSVAAVAGHVKEVVREAPLPHINTYAGHPVGCAVALANLEIFEREGLAAHAASLEPLLRERLAGIAAARGDVVGHDAIGLLSTLELRVPAGRAAPELADVLRHRCLEAGLLVRTGAFGERVAVYFYPPLVVDEADVAFAFDTIAAVVEDVLGA